jgi:hypothetical protein
MLSAGKPRYEATHYVREQHEAFVKRSWCRGARAAWESLASRLRRPEVSCLVAHVPGYRTEFKGWAAVDNGAGAVIWAYTKSFPSTERRQGLMTSLLFDLGVDPSQPTACLYWSPWAALLATRGYRFVYSPRGGLRAAA